jgi:hypothetical protein
MVLVLDFLDRYRLKADCVLVIVLVVVVAVVLDCFPLPAEPSTTMTTTTMTRIGGEPKGLESIAQGLPWVSQK